MEEWPQLEVRLFALGFAIEAVTVVFRQALVMQGDSVFDLEAVGWNGLHLGRTWDEFDGGWQVAWYWRNHKNLRDNCTMGYRHPIEIL